MMKLAKDSVNYSKGHADSHCGAWRPGDKGYCRHFIEPVFCRVVEGRIDRYYWCEKFARAAAEKQK